MLCNQVPQGRSQGPGYDYDRTAPELHGTIFELHDGYSRLKTVYAAKREISGDIPTDISSQAPRPLFDDEQKKLRYPIPDRGIPMDTIAT